MKVDAVILAKSTMWGKFCVAGIDIPSGMWLRFTGYEDGEPIDDWQMHYINAPGCCQPLDFVSVRITKRYPHANHMEDIVIERDGWLKLGHFTTEQVLQYHPEESYRYVFGNGGEYITEQEMSRLRFRYSLILIRADNLTLRVDQNHEGRLRSKASFIHNNRHYSNIRVTDPEYETYAGNIDTAYLVMSMPVKPLPANGRYYKLIAKILA